MVELVERVIESEKTKQDWRNKHNSIEFQEASKLNEILFGESLNQRQGCECIEDLFLMLSRPNINEKIKLIMEKQFKVKPGRLITGGGLKHLSEHSSDADCMAHLQVRPENIKFFEEKPSNWKKLVEDYVPRKAGEPEIEAETETEEVEETETSSEETETETETENEEVEDEVSGMVKKDMKAELTAAGIEFEKTINHAGLVDLVRAHRNNV